MHHLIGITAALSSLYYHLSRFAHHIVYVERHVCSVT